MQFFDKINNKNLYDDFKVIILTGTEKLLEFPERKESVNNDWRESNGMEYDLSSPVFKDKDCELQFGILTDTDVDFWTNYNAFFNELKLAGKQDLFIFDHGQTYEVFYQSSSNFKKTLKRLKNVQKVLVKFTIKFKVITP